MTKRERQVAEKLAQGLAVKEIAAELGLSPETVHVHRANLMEKLGVSNDVELARRMFERLVMNSVFAVYYRCRLFLYLLYCRGLPVGISLLLIGTPGAGGHLFRSACVWG